MPRHRNGERRRLREAEVAKRRMVLLVERHTLVGRVTERHLHATARVIRQADHRPA